MALTVVPWAVFYRGEWNLKLAASYLTESPLFDDDDNDDEEEEEEDKSELQMNNTLTFSYPLVHLILHSTLWMKVRKRLIFSYFAN